VRSSSFARSITSEVARSYEFSLHAIARKRDGRGIDPSSDPEIKTGVDRFLGDVAAKLGSPSPRNAASESAS
jgi:hypothetical protein